MISPRFIKPVVVFVIVLFVLIVTLAGSDFVPTVDALGAGPPNGFTGAPGENDCTACHIDNAGAGQFTLGVPPTYFPGRTYSVTVTHTNSDMTRQRWGFQMTSLIGENGAERSRTSVTCADRIRQRPQLRQSHKSRKLYEPDRRGVLDVQRDRAGNDDADHVLCRRQSGEK